MLLQLPEAEETAVPHPLLLLMGCVVSGKNHVEVDDVVPRVGSFVVDASDNGLG